MGGIFGEGVDLVGDRLIGCAIVGVGLPQVNPRQEILRRYYDEQSGTGFDYAYRYPGMNKVLQAAGRVIRTAGDRGVVLLLDDRFARSEYTRLFPRHWQHLKYLNGTEALKEELDRFWGREAAVDRNCPRAFISSRTRRSPSSRRVWSRHRSRYSRWRRWPVSAFRCPAPAPRR